jgi:hypothetical protein
MTMASRLFLATAALAIGSACGPSGPTSAQLCDKNAQVDQSTKVGDCTRIPPGNLFGDRTACVSATDRCSLKDRTLLMDVLTCAEKLPVCSEGSKEAWVGARTGCVMRLSGISQECKDSFAGLLPDPSGIFDAGVPDAGPMPINDGGTALDLVVVADESQFAFAWTSLQGPDKVVKWAIIGINDAGVRDEPFFVSMVSTRALLYDAGALEGRLEDGGLNVYRRWLMVGEASDGKSALGVPDAGAMTMRDAGAMCLGPLDCPTDRVCSLGQCSVLTCQPGGPVTCPGGYQCFPNGTCNRTSFDSGVVFDAGMGGMMVVGVPMPFISNDFSALTRVPAPSPQIYLGGFPGKRPDVVAVDSARLFVALEQEGQLIGHSSFRRGRDFPDDSLTASSIDTVGSRLRVAYNRESRLLYACYIVGRGVRVRVSADEGRTWAEQATTIEPPPLDDGGLGSVISDCDIAAWRTGGALMVTVEDDKLVSRTVSPTLMVEDPGQPAMISSAPDAGNVFNPLRPQIATLPEDSLVHIVFTATRTLSGGLSDAETYGVYRDGMLGTFTQPLPLTYTGVGTGNPLPQDYATVAIDPKTKRGIAAYTTLLPGNEALSTVQVSLWNPAAGQRRWVTGSDLNVFELDVDRQTRILFPFPEFQGRQVDAFSPVFAALPNGKIWLSMMVGVRMGGGGNDFKLWAVPFDFEEPTPAGNVRGWFKKPARKLSETRAWDPRGGGIRPTVTGFSADSQLSFSAVFTEGFGAAGEQEGGRAIIVTVP